jgi:molecular chaperone HscB
MICASCGAPLGAELDYFEALGLPRRLTIDRAALERAYHGLGRRIHPDRFASAPPPVRDASLRGTARLTRAYRTLSDPVNRGLYWLELNGQKLAENNKSVPPELAEMVFSVQEQLDDLRSARTASNSQEPDAAMIESEARAVEESRAELRSTIEAAERDLHEYFARSDLAADQHWEAEDRSSENDDTRDAQFMELKSILSRIAYLRTLARDIDRELEMAQAA